MTPHDPESAVAGYTLIQRIGVANEQEFGRFSINAEIDEKTLREIYRKPFEMVVNSDSPPKCIMTAYNYVNGQHMDINTHSSRMCREKGGSSNTW